MEELKEEGEGAVAMEKVDYNVLHGRMLTMAGLFDVCTEGTEVTC